MYCSLIKETIENAKKELPKSSEVKKIENKDENPKSEKKIEIPQNILN